MEVIASIRKPGALLFLLMTRHKPFPFPALPKGEVTPVPGPGDLQELLQRDVRIVRWFIEERWGRRARPDSTLGQLLTISEKLDLNAPAKPIESIEPEVARHLLHASAALARLAWAIRALHGNDAIDWVDGSFIDDEVMGEDSKQPDAERRLPGGVGTLVFAGRLVQAGGGRILSLNGKGVPGHDIRWVTKLGDTVLVERKDRSYEAGQGDTPEKRVKRVIAEVRNAAETMPRDPPGAGRVLVVGFQHLVRENEAEAVDKGYEAGLEEAFGGGAVPFDDLPHVVIVEHLGLEPKTDGEKWNFFSPQPLNPEPRFMARVAPLLVRALGAVL